MKTTRFLRVGLVAVMVVGALCAAGPGTTIAYFQDTHEGTGSLSADVGYSTNPGNGNGGGNGNDNGAAFNDANGNGQQDQGEATYHANQLRNFNDPNANLVIPAGVGEITHQNKRISITAASIDSAVNISSGSGAVVLEATEGDVRVVDTTLRSKNNNIDISAEAAIDVDGANITSTNAITFDAQTISGRNALFHSKNNRIDLTSPGAITVDDAYFTARNNEIALRARSISAQNAAFIGQNGRILVSAQRNGGGVLDATNANIETQSNDIALRSVGNMTLDSARLYSQNDGATADLGTTSATLSVDETIIDDSDATLIYSPDGVIVVGSSSNQTST